MQTSINGRYRIVRTIGTGGMGSVYAADDERLGRQVALKLLRADLAADPKARERFLREAQIAAQLIHPHVVRTYDVGDAPEGPYLVQELLDGQTLDTRIPLPPEQAIAVAIGLADALSYIHGQGYVHCDIKPQNIMLLGDPRQPRVVLLDFGIARVAGAATTTLIATPHYLAPERAAGEPPTASSDLYALGIVLYHMLSGHPPFDAPTIHAIIEQHRAVPLPPLNLATPEAPALEAIIRKLTAKQPADRYDSAAALRSDLIALQRGAIHALPTLAVANQPRPAVVPVAAPAPPASIATVSHKSIRRRYLLIPLVLSLLLAGAMIAQKRPQPTNADVLASPARLPAASSITTISVPAVIGLPVEQARQQIVAAGLRFAVGDTIQSDQPVGTVVQTNPAPSAAVPPDTQVIVQASAGQPPVVAPQQGDDNKNPPKANPGKGKGNDKGKGKKDD